jgi:SagB-type dehydrogenase family enzyme
MTEKMTPLDEAAVERLAAVLAYHEESKHRYDRMAPSLGYMDWANQPEPFRSYRDCETISLPLLAHDPDLAYHALFSPPTMSPTPLSKASLGAVLELSLGLSAWKASGSNRWALRMVPSSGNLHPTEAYVIVNSGEHGTGIDTIPPGIYHYNPLHHRLERRLRIGSELQGAFAEAFLSPGIWVAFTSIFWREAWKYGLRAYRYCQLDMGHALAGLSLAARFSGWQCRLIHGAAPPLLDRLLGLDHHGLPAAEAEHAECLCHLGPGSQQAPQVSQAGIKTLCAGLRFEGVPNHLSRAHEHWKGIDRIARLTAGALPKPPAETVHQWAFQFSPSPKSAATVIRQRRSAVAYDPREVMPREAFMAIIARTLPQPDRPPFDTGVAAPAINLFIFLHRVRGLRAGLYALCRSRDHEDQLRAACDPTFIWEPILPELPLYLLKPADFVYEAIQISCDQTIAGYGAFSLGMVACFHSPLETAPGIYPHLFWEAGQVGHLLYLEAEAQGYAGTGIGCFFDDGMHNLLGLKNRDFQSLYHFTIGTPVIDTRLKTLPAYNHRKQGDRI